MEFLLEILTEELPASHLKSALEQLGSRFLSGLESSGLDFSELKVLGTCRRLIVRADVGSGQEDSAELVTGPPKSVAYLPDGRPSPAALGFARGQGVPVESLQIVQTPKGEYVGIRKTRLGKPASEILAAMIPGVIASITFAKTMRWKDSPFRFSRPITNILCVLDGNVLPFAFEGLTAGNSTPCRPARSRERLSVSGFMDYVEQLGKHGVIVDNDERRAMIRAQIEERLSALGAAVYPDEALLDKLALNVEHPYAVLGAFPERYLSLPIEVLATAMREGQNLFSVVKGGKQLPYFLGVADVLSDPKELIRKGNERVLKARLEDARFFWEHDLKTPLADRRAGLKNVLFQEKLGTYDDKAQRLKKLAAYLCEKIGAAAIKAEAVEAAALCKTDLLTDMVKEFPSLQGRMGGLYAKTEGYAEPVHRAIYEHYLPIGLDDDSPESVSGAVLSLADKMDSIVGVTGIGVQASGSSDPFGLRRNAHGILKVILDRKIDLSFPRFIDKAIAVHGDQLTKPAAEIRARVIEYFSGRLRFIFERLGFRYDLIAAALGPGIDNIHFAAQRVQALDALKASPQFEPFILMAKRITNILRDAPPCKVNPDLFADKEERDLFSTLSVISENVEPMIAKGDFARAQSIIFKIQPALNVFFDKVLVMAEDKKTRQNRLGLLQAIRKLLIQVADYSQVVVEGEKSGKGADVR
jgi:glycyl-tRNA synthetase beta chain